MSENPFVNYLVEAVGAALASLIGLVWHDNKRRVNRLEEKVETKADKSELDRQRDHIEKLFDAQAEIIKDMNGGFDRITNLIHSAELRIMTELGKKADR